jgi:hypothetical protein
MTKQVDKPWLSLVPRTNELRMTLLAQVNLRHDIAFVPLVRAQSSIILGSSMTYFINDNNLVLMRGSSAACTRHGDSPGRGDNHPRLTTVTLTTTQFRFSWKRPRGAKILLLITS